MSSSDSVGLPGSAPHTSPALALLAGAGDRER
jgi:hypothetical protein